MRKLLTFLMAVASIVFAAYEPAAAAVAVLDNANCSSTTTCASSAGGQASPYTTQANNTISSGATGDCVEVYYSGGTPGPGSGVTSTAGGNYGWSPGRNEGRCKQHGRNMVRAKSGHHDQRDLYRILYGKHPDHGLPFLRDGKRNDCCCVQNTTTTNTGTNTAPSVSVTSPSGDLAVGMFADDSNTAGSFSVGGPPPTLLSDLTTGRVSGSAYRCTPGQFSFVPLELPLSPTGVFAIRIERPFDVSVQRPQYTDGI
jgi:hypothetical protein